MKKLLLSFIAILMLMPSFLMADEGMWFLMHIQRLNQRDMQKMGLQLTAEEIYSINNSSLKDAIVQFNGGCTAEIISKDGLVLTNHHCGYDAIAELSTPENNYLRDGFWAKNRGEEMKPKSLFVRFFVRMDDVTKRILGVVNNNMTEAEREKAINQEISKIQKENDGGGKYTVSVRPFFQGNEYYYFVYEDFKDVRLVGTPTESIGKFGGDTDNWEWPRHTGDFALFRVYANKDNQPADFSKDNVPLKPKHHLPISIKGINEGDFAMILGYPGRTNRWMPAEGIEQNVKFAYPAWVEGSKMSMDMMKPHMDKDDKIRLDYASKYASIANYWKNRQGMIDALSQFKTADAKRKVEQKFNTWANKKENKEAYGSVMNDINTYYQMTNEKAKHDNYLMTFLRGSAFAGMPSRMGSGLIQYANANEKEREGMKARLTTMINGSFETINLNVEKDILAGHLALYSDKGQKHGLAPMVKTMVDSKADFKKFAHHATDLSIFSSKERLLAFLEIPDENIIKNDPLYKLSNDLTTHYNVKSDELKTAENNYQRGFRNMVEGLRVSKMTTIQYPDANSTLRLTYGKVRALPADKRNDAKINNYTTLEGMVKKHKKGDLEFDLSQPLIDLFNKKDFGQYADKAGYMPVNFLTDNDITGGNSGSPVLNGKGELIGLAFDGNIEAMAGDVIFDKNLQRTINVDARFILFIIEKYAGAKHLIDEMTIVK